MLLSDYVLMPMFALVNNIVSCAREMYLVYKISKYSTYNYFMVNKFLLLDNLYDYCPLELL